MKAITGSRHARRAWAAARRRHLRKGRVYIVEFRHDSGCGIYTRERLCSCNPDRVLKDDSGKVLARVEGAGFFDPLELAEVAP